MLAKNIQGISFSENSSDQKENFYENMSLACDSLVSQMEAIIVSSPENHAPSNISLFCIGIGSKMIINELQDLRCTFDFDGDFLPKETVLKMVDKIIEYYKDLSSDVSNLIYEDIISTR